MTPTDRPRLDDTYSTLANNASDEKPVPLSPYYPLLSAPVEPDEIGRLGHFRVIRLLGSGGMGMVFHAVDMRLGRPVALKVMKPDPSNKELSGERFHREAEAMAQIKHDNLITIYDIGKEADTYFIAMELLLGGTLEAHVAHKLQWELSEILRVGIEIAAGLNAMHIRDLIHRDIKPANIWLEEPHGRVKILDFGLVRATKDDVAITNTGVIMGTPAFMAPEQIRGQIANVRSDLYSFGCVLYLLCTGRLPHRADNSMAQLAAVVADEPTAVRQLNPAIPVPLADLVMQLLSKDPKKRPANADEVARRLRQIADRKTDKIAKSETAVIEGMDSSSFDVAQLRRQPSFLERHWLKLVVGSALTALLAVIAALAVFFFRIPPPPPPPGPPKGNPPFLVAADEKGWFFLGHMKKHAVVNWPMPFKGPKGGGFKEKKKEMDHRVSLNGIDMPRSIFMHPLMPHENPPSLSFRLDKEFKTFAGSVTQNDSAPESWTPTFFEIYGDNKLLWRSKGVTSVRDTQAFSIPVNDVTILKLQTVVDAADIRGCHAVWLDPHLLK